MSYILFHDDCLNKMSKLDENSIDSIVTDPPYGLSFMGKSWDHGVPGKSFWSEALRVAKPGAHLLAFGGTRTYHRLASAIEDAGWEIRDCVMWVYGSGFPKSHDVSKAIDKAAGAEREVVGSKLGLPGYSLTDGKGGLYGGGFGANGTGDGECRITAPATEAARQWEGWGTALKPAWEPIILARKPLVGTVAENVLRYGTGGLNIDGCRVGEREKRMLNRSGSIGYGGSEPQGMVEDGGCGRWPANVIHDGSEEVVGLFPYCTGKVGMRGNTGQGNAIYGKFNHQEDRKKGVTDSGSAARFFYCAKASKADRDEGCEKLEIKPCGTMEDDNYDIKTGSGNSRNTLRHNHHPTVKPTSLMRYLCRLVTPPGGVVLDPFMGSGSTGKAAMLEKFKFIGIEMNHEYIEIAKARIDYASKQGNVSFGDNDEHQRGLFDGLDDADNCVPNPVN